MDEELSTETEDVRYREESRVDWIAGLVPAPSGPSAPPAPAPATQNAEDDEEDEKARGPEPPAMFHWEWIEGVAVLAGACPRCDHAMSVVVPRRLSKAAAARRTRLPDRLRVHPRDAEARYRGGEHTLRAELASEAAATRRARGRPRELGKARLRRQVAGLTAMEQIPGPAPSDILVVAICNCLEPHPGRPDGRVGCGSYGGLTLAWSAGRRA